MGWFERLVTVVSRLVMIMVVAVFVECGFEFNMAVHTETKYSSVCDIANKKKAQEHCKALFI